MILAQTEHCEMKTSGSMCKLAMNLGVYGSGSSGKL